MILQLEVPKQHHQLTLMLRSYDYSITLYKATPAICVSFAKQNDLPTHKHTECLRTQKSHVDLWIDIMFLVLMNLFLTLRIYSEISLRFWPCLSVGIAPGHGLEGWWVGVRAPKGARFFPYPRHSNRFSDPPILLSNVYREPFPLGQNGRGLKLTTHL
jgi:hypothetical protein